MKFQGYIATVAVLLSISSCLANEYVEPTDFNVVEALALEGIPVNALPNKRSDRCSTICSILSDLYHVQVILAGVDGYDEWRGQFWSSYQRDALPACIFQPQNAHQVSIAVLLSRWSQCPFAVKSGGHAAMKEASSATGGVSIDMAQMKSIVLTGDKKIAKVAPGNTWYDVFVVLEKEELAVVGGRVQNIGVGGFTLGGGISFHANERGWGCDNVANYELVTAAGAVLQVNAASYPQLFRSLRGGGPNFGIVTRFDLETFHQGPIYGGSRTYHYPTQNRAVNDALVKFTSKRNPDLGTAIWHVIGYMPVEGGIDFMSVLMVHKKPDPTTTAFDEWKDITPLSDTLKVRTIADITAENAAPLPNGLREHYWTHTFKFDGNFIQWVSDMFYEELNPIKKEVEGLMVTLLFQTVSKESVKKMRRNGGNSLPLVESEAPYFILNFAGMWSKENSQDEAKVIGAAAKIMTRAADEGRRRGLFVPYIYMNYGSEYTDVMGSYEKKNIQRLERVARQVDPTGVFQKLRSGYFKFGGAPTTEGPGILGSAAARSEGYNHNEL